MISLTSHIDVYVHFMHMKLAGILLYSCIAGIRLTHLVFVIFNTDYSCSFICVGEQRLLRKCF